MQISTSALQLYLQCPRAYKLHVLDGIESQHKCLSLCRATTVNKVISALHDNTKLPCDYTREEIEILCEKIWREEIVDVSQEDLNAIVVQKKTATKNRETAPALTKGERILQNIQTWCFEYSREEIDAEVLCTNVAFEDTIGDVTFSGYINTVRKMNGSSQLLVFKTAHQPPAANYLQRDFTLLLQLHALWHGSLSVDVSIGKADDLPDVYVYYFPHLERYQKKNGNHKKGDRKGDPLIHVPQSREALLDFEYELLYAVSGIHNEFFPMMPKNAAGCSICQYADKCNGKHSVFFDVSFDVQELEESKEEVA